MRAIAWDDQPQYLEMLQRHLERLGIHLEIYTSEDEFSDRFLSNEMSWDFIITDLVKADSPAQGEEEIVGQRIAQAIARDDKGQHLPIFVVTRHYDRLSAREMSLPPNVVVKSKSTYPGWLAGEIRQELVRRGLFVDHKKVFLIYGHDKSAPGTRKRIEHFLRERGIQAITLGDSPLRVEIAQGLLNKMNECGAFLAICTPDDETAGIFQPRPNVLIEIGLALGLSRGLQRLILLQRWGPGKQDQAILPSDLHGILTHRFEGDIDLHFETLTKDLRALGIEV